MEEKDENSNESQSENLKKARQENLETPYEEVSGTKGDTLEEELSSGPDLVKRINTAAIVISLIILVAAVGYRAGLFDSSPANAGSSPVASAQQGPAGGCTSVGGGCNVRGQASQSSGGCGVGGCSSSASGAPIDIKAMESKVSEAYAKYTGTSGFFVEIKDLGCHQEATITKDGKVLNVVSISGDRMSLIQ